jgi:hypothetical protein
LEDIQHQVQSNCLELSISSSYPNDHASTASLFLGTGQIRPFRPRQPGRTIGLVFPPCLAAQGGFCGAWRDGDSDPRYAREDSQRKHADGQGKQPNNKQPNKKGG